MGLVLCVATAGAVGCGEQSTGATSPTKSTPTEAQVDARLYQVRRDGVSDYTGWLTVQLKDYVPSRSQLRREMLPYFAANKLGYWSNLLHYDFEVVRRQGGLYPPPLKSVIHPFAWRRTAIAGDSATLRFLGYQVDVTRHNRRLVMPDRKFVLRLHLEDGRWKVVTQSAHWITGAGPEGVPHDEKVSPPLM